MMRKWSEILWRWMRWRGGVDKELCWWCVKSWEDIRMVHRSMRNDSRVADEVYITRCCLVLEDCLFFSLCSFSCIAKQVRLWNSSDSTLVLIPSKWTLKHLVLIMISHYWHEYHICPILPITLERVLFIIPDIECTVNIVRPLLLILFGTNVRIPIAISHFAICVAATLWNWMCLHPSNGCRYCNEPLPDTFLV